MTRREHYAEAERLLDAASDLTGPVKNRDYDSLILTAQVHATLACVVADAAVND